jgi:hypothetical protein
MVTTSTEIWRGVFTNWPEAIPRRGLIVSTLNEPIPFKSFLLKGETVLLERAIPDPMGTRFIVLAFDAIHMLKLTDPLKESVLNEAGYVGQLAKM